MEEGPLLREAGVLIADHPDAALDGFAALGLDPAVVTLLGTFGYEEPTPIQRQAIPLLLGGRDLLGQAATGTGKTAAFALPMLQRIARPADAAVLGDRTAAEERAGGPDRAVRGLVLVPTRELAIQVAEAIHKYGRRVFGSNVLPVYGGQAIQQQLRSLRRGVDVVVATPGRALDHIRRGSLDTSKVSMVVLDEADEMLDMGFAEDLEAILESLPAERQTALFSATIPPRIAAIAERHLRTAARVMIGREAPTPGVLPRVRQVAYVVQRRHKVAALGRVLDMENPTSVIVFCRTRTEVDELSETLSGRGYRAEALHGGLSQEQRDRVMRRFRDGTAELLVATDVAARGLDIEHVSHVVNFDVPPSADAYIHRIGRTGRAGREGVAITFAEPREHRMLRNIEQSTRQRIAVELVPTIIDLRAHRLELTRAALQEALLDGGLEPYRGVAEALSEEFDVLDVAAAAVRLIHEADAPDDEEEDIPSAMAPPGGRTGSDRGPRGGVRERQTRGSRESRAPRDAKETRPPRESRDARPPRAVRDAAPGDAPQRGEPDEGVARDTHPLRRRGDRHGRGSELARLYIGLGRRNGMRPGDIVGAIANEAGVDAREIGAIDIADHFSLVEVPGDAVDTIIRALRGTTLRGKRVMVRRDRDS